MKENIKTISDFIKGKSGNADAKKAIEELEKVHDNEELKRLDLIRENIKDSHYAKIFDTEMQNVKLKEELNWQNSPNVKVLFFIMGAIVIIGTVIFSTKYIQNEIIMKKITNVENTLNNINEKLNFKKQDINMSK